MTELYLADALQQVSPELVMEATLPLRRQKKRGWLAFAACFALVTVCSFALNNLGMGGGSEHAAMESDSVSEGITDITDGSSAGHSYVVYDSSSWDLISTRLDQMAAHADTIVIGRYSGGYEVLTEDSVTVHLYDFAVEHCVKGSAEKSLTVRLPVLREVRGTVEETDYAFIRQDSAFFDPTEDGQVLLFLQDCGGGIFRKAQEPFTAAIGADGTVTLRSNLLLPYAEREALSTTEVQLEDGCILLYTDDMLTALTDEEELSEDISGRHINDILEELGSDLRILY